MDNFIRLALYYLDLPRRRPLIWIPPLLIVLAIGAYIVLTMPRVYESRATIALQSQSNNLVQSTAISERLQFIERRVLARGNLIALERKHDLLPGMRGSVPDSLLAEVLRSQITIEVVATAEVSQYYTNTTVFSITSRGDAPERAAALTTEIVSLIEEEIRRARLSQASDTSQFLEREVERLAADARTLDARWDEFLTANEALLPSRMSLYETELQDRQVELSELELEASNLAAETKLVQAEIDLRAPLVDAAARGRRDQLIALNTELSSKLTVMAEAHPEIRSLRSRIAALEAEIAATPANVDLDAADPELGLLIRRVANANERLAEFDKRHDEITARLAWLRNTIAEMPAIETQMTALAADREAAQSILVDMRARLNTARIGERLETDQQGEQLQVLEAPDVPLYPSGSGRSRTMLLVGAAALAIAFGILALVDYFDPRVRSAAHLRRTLKGEPFMVLPRWAAGKRPRTA